MPNELQDLKDCLKALVKCQRDLARVHQIVVQKGIAFIQMYEALEACIEEFESLENRPDAYYGAKAAIAVLVGP